MNHTLRIEDLAIVVDTTNHHPQLLNVDFLKNGGIVPDDLELACPPVYKPEASQVTYQKGLILVAENKRIIFLQVIRNDMSRNINLAILTDNYVHKLPNIYYLKVGFNVNGHILFDSYKEAMKYLTETLIHEGKWQEFGRMPVYPSISYTLALEQCMLNLTVSLTKFKDNKEREISGVAFAATFDYQIEGNSPQERLESLSKSMTFFHTDLETYKSIVGDQIIWKKSDKSMT
jgi:hypothetical protein